MMARATVILAEGVQHHQQHRQQQRLESTFLGQEFFSGPAPQRVGQSDEIEPTAADGESARNAERFGRQTTTNVVNSQKPIRGSSPATSNESEQSISQKLHPPPPLQKQDESIVKMQRNQHQQTTTVTGTTTIPDPQNLQLSANYFKNAGNKLCAVHRFEEAILHYNQAIIFNPEVAIFFSNRALCHLKLQHWPEAIQDCRRALELDPNLIKAHFFLGQAFAEINNYDDALKHLQRAHELAKKRQMNFGDDIAYQIRLIKRHQWNKIEKQTELAEDEFHNYLVELIRKDKEEMIKDLKNRLNYGEGSSSWQPTKASSPSSSTLEQDQQQASTSSSNVATATTNTNQTTLEEQEFEIKSKCDNFIAKLETMFNNLRLQRQKREVPDYLCGKISFEIMHDPVITPSGITYDREDIEEHLMRVGHFDPITRQPLKSNQLITNLAMKEVVDAYLSENEWASYY